MWHLFYTRGNIQEPKWERVCKMRSCKIAEFQGNEQTQYVEYKRKYSGVIWMTILVGRSMKVNCGRFFFMIFAEACGAALKVLWPLFQVLMICQHTSNPQCLVAPSRMCSNLLSLESSLFLNIAIKYVVQMLRIPITDGRLNMGTWQVCELRSKWLLLFLYVY